MQNQFKRELLLDIQEKTAQNGHRDEEAESSRPKNKDETKILILHILCLQDLLRRPTIYFGGGRGGGGWLTAEKQQKFAQTGTGFSY